MLFDTRSGGISKARGVFAYRLQVLVAHLFPESRGRCTSTRGPHTGGNQGVCRVRSVCQPVCHCRASGHTLALVVKVFFDADRTFTRARYSGVAHDGPRPQQVPARTVEPVDGSSMHLARTSDAKTRHERAGNHGREVSGQGQALNHPTHAYGLLG